jgi:hypothetical protein
VTVAARLDAQEAEIRLPGRYAVSPSVLDKIRVVKGVVSAEENAA